MRVNCRLEIQEIRRTLAACATDEDDTNNEDIAGDDVETNSDEMAGDEEETNNEEIAGDEHEQQEMDWPSQDAQPANEFTEINLAAKCFPTLFANKKAIFDSPRLVNVKFQDAVCHLLKWAYYDAATKKWIYPFSAHPRFVFWCWNMCQRHASIKMADLILKRSAEDRELSLEEIQEQLNASNRPPAFVRRLQRFGQSLTGSCNYWYKHCQQLMSILEQKGPATLFVTYSMADRYWPDLHRILETQGAPWAAKRKAINENPQIVASFFIKKVKAWNKLFLGDVLDEDWSWMRYENQGRGTIHAHLMTKLKHDPGLIKLCETVYKGRQAGEVLVRHEKNELEEPLTQQDQVRFTAEKEEGEAAEKRVCNYCNTLISTMNPLSPEQRQQFVAGDHEEHACAKRCTPEMTTEELDDDYANILNTVQRHTQHTSYCERKNFSGEKVCRFGFPFDICNETSIDFEVKKDGHVSCILTTKRNDEMCNKHNRIQLQYFRSNVDMQIILDWRACYNYISKYAAKANKPSETINEVLSKVVERSDSTTDVTKAFRKMMIATVGDG